MSTVHTTLSKYLFACYFLFADIFKITFERKVYQEYHHSVKEFLTFNQA